MHQSLTKSMTAYPAPDGLAAHLVHLKNRAGMHIVVMDLGATWLSCRIPVGDEMRELLLGVDSMQDHLKQNAHLGSTVGRFANRIRDGRFTIDGRPFQVNTNEGDHCLHGGSQGFDKRRWEVVHQEDQLASFLLHSTDGDQGFPGHCEARVTYQLSDENEVIIQYSGLVDKPCPVSLTNHAYFNLGTTHTRATCLAHHVKICADFYLETDSALIPTGRIVSVDGTYLDFNHGKPLGQDLQSSAAQVQAMRGYDHALLLNPDLTNGGDCVVEVQSPDRLVRMNIATTLPCLQLYSGNHLAGCPGRQGQSYEGMAGFCLETQFPPDAPNHPEWPAPDSVLRPGQLYRHETRYLMSVES